MNSVTRERERIADQLRRAWDGDAWFGPGLKQTLKDVSSSQATARPVAGAHSIAELVLHVAVWNRIAHRRLSGLVPDPSPAEDFPATPPAWEEMVAGVERAVLDLAAAVAGLDDSRLEETVPGQSYTVYFMLHGAVQHTVYHAGQIGVLKKAGATE
jgi:uncharacterized damage-inducible protein DinB